MSLPNYESTRGTTNLARVARMILGPCTDVLCALLRKEVTPSALMHNVNTFIANHPKHRPCPINKDQQKLVCGGNYSEFDITLLYTLLRNAPTIPPPSNNWGKNPDKNDRSVSANIERIRMVRNQYGHKSDISLTDTAFNEKCQEIFTIIQELECYLGADTFYQDAVAHIKTCSMDPEQEAKYINQLHDINIKLDYVIEEVQKSKTASIPYSVRVSYERDILEWKEEDSVFLETHNFPVMLNQVRQQPFVTFVGVPGSGKTVTARHIALILQGEGYDILPIADKNKIEDYCNSVIPQVLVIDDVIGVFGLNEMELHMINKYSRRLSNPINPKTKTLMTCREAVFKNGMLSDCFLVKDENVVNLQSKDNALNENDKHNLLEKYNIDRDLLNPNNLALSSTMFPFLCKLYSSEKKLEIHGPMFFISPVPCIKKEMDSLKNHNKIQYASLVLLMANENKLSEKVLENKNDGFKENQNINSLFGKMKCNILNKCKVSPTIKSFELIDALTQMEGTYTKKNDEQFTFIHDSMFEIIACHFGTMFPELILDYASSNYIANYIKVEQQKKNEIECEEDRGSESNKLSKINHESAAFIDLCIQLHESQYPKLAERLLKDLQNGEFYYVFGNKALKRQSVLQGFIVLLEKKSYDKLYNILLSELENSEICIWNYGPHNSDVKDIQVHFCLINKTFIHNQIRTSVRGISWLILYGHHPILEYLLNQMIQKNGNVDDLFSNSFNKRLQTSVNNEPVIIEQCRLLCLGCYSGDLITVQILLKHVNADTINYKLGHSKGFFLEQNPIIIACKYGYLDIVMELLKAGGDINIRVNHHSPLTVACENRQTSIVRALLKLRPVVDEIHVVYTPLQWACREENIIVVEELIKAKADVNLKVPLITACIKGNLCIVKELIKAGADVNRLNFGVSPLLAACINGHFNVIKELISSGADVNLKIKDESKLATLNRIPHEHDKLIPRGVNIMMEEITPLVAACDIGYLNILKYLMKIGAKVDPKDNDKTTLHFPSYWDHLNIVKSLTEMESNFGLKCNNAKEKPLIAACENGQLEVVKEMIKCGADVNIKYRDKTPLLAACFKGHSHVVKELVNAGANVNLGNKFISPLQVASYEGHLSIIKELKKATNDDNHKYILGQALLGACFFGHLSVVKELIACHVEVNLKYGKETPLTTASFMGHLNICKELIKAGASINLNNGSRTPLTLACYRGHINIVRELIKEGANVNQSNGKEIPLILACEGGHVDIVNELIKAGANVNQSNGKEIPLIPACEGGHRDIVNKLIKAGAKVNQSNSKTTPLLAACREGDSFVVDDLIKAGANVNQNDGTKTPLTTACEKGQAFHVEYLIKAGADVNQNDGIKTPLTAACENGCLGVDLFRKLIEAGANVNLSDGIKTPLTAACEKGLWNVDLVLKLIEAGANVNLSDGNDTPLTTACKRGHLKVIGVLIKAKADVNQSDGNKTPLTAACESGYLHVVKALVNAGAKVNESNGNKTPLTAACEKGRSDVVENLIKAGGDVNQSDGSKTPLMAACEEGHLKVVKILIKADVDVNQSDGYNTALTAACERRQWEVIKELILANVDVN